MIMIKYIKQEMPDIHHKGEKKCYYRIETRGNMTHKDLLRQMALRGVSEGVAAMTIHRMTEAIVELMRQGFSVTIDGLGCFSMSLGVDKDKTVEDMEGTTKRNATSIIIRDVNYRSDKKLVSALNQECKLERGYTSRINRCRLTLPQRLNAARDYLSSHQIMRIADYVRLTGLSRTTASVELRRFAASVSTTGIDSSGSGPSLVYFLKLNE